MKFPLFTELHVGGKVYYWEPITLSDSFDYFFDGIVEDVIPGFPLYKPNLGRYFVNSGKVLCAREL